MTTAEKGKLSTPFLQRPAEESGSEEKYILRPPFEQKFKPTAVKPLIHEVRIAALTEWEYA